MRVKTRFEILARFIAWQDRAAWEPEHGKVHKTVWRYFHNLGA